ncbi:MAG TPA: efflux RND transporter periplasmic adaptor subunit [Acidobacteriaceae bacterium]|nr:efflux RND transporter periplasmic adaptor subunit [Acidobacteriaceae bacterium]
MQVRVFRYFATPAAVATSLGLVLFLAGCNARPVLSSKSAAHSTAKDRTAPIPAKRTEVAEPTTSTASTIGADSFTTTGPLVVDQQANIAAQRDGQIVEVRAHLADHVAKGQVLALLDSSELQASRDAAAAKVTALKAEVREWKAEQEVETADLHRAALLRAAQVMDEVDWEHFRYKLRETIAEVARYEADESVAQYQLQALNVKLDQSRITAPFPGVVGRASARVGQQVKTSDVLFWVTAERPLHILFTIPESELRAVHPGTRLELTTPVFPELHQAAIVRRVSPVVDPSSDSIEIEGDLAHPSPLLKPGMSMQIHLGKP